MKRDFLKNLGLEDEIVDKIMTEYGKSISTENKCVGICHLLQTSCVAYLSWAIV